MEAGLDTVTERRHANLIADIVGHPQQAPSLSELAHMNPGTDEDVLRRRLEDLRDMGVVDVVTVEDTSGRWHDCYRLTEKARKLIDDHDVFPGEAWQRQYGRVEIPAEIKEIESIPRPGQ